MSRETFIRLRFNEAKRALDERDKKIELMPTYVPKQAPPPDPRNTLLVLLALALIIALIF